MGINVLSSSDHVSALREETCDVELEYDEDKVGMFLLYAGLILLLGLLTVVEKDTDGFAGVEGLCGAC